MLASGVGLALLCVTPARLVRDPPIVHVASAPITEGRLRGPFVHGGAVRAVSSTEVGPASPSALTAIEARVHSFVRAGAPLAILDDAGTAGSVEAANDLVAQAEAQLRAREDAELEVQRRCDLAEQLFADGRLSSDDVEAARAALAQAGRDVADSEIQVDSEREQAATAAAAWERTVLRAPFDGFITSFVPNGPYFVMAAAASPVEVVAAVGAAEANALRPGDVAMVDDGQRQRRGHVLRLEPEGDGQETVVVDVNQSVKDLTPGTAVQLRLDESARPVVVRIPNAALTFSPSPDTLDAAGEAKVPTVMLHPPGEGASRVWVYDGTAFIAVNVRVGDHDDEFSELVDGPLRPGDQVVTAAY